MKSEAAIPAAPTRETIVDRLRDRPELFWSPVVLVCFVAVWEFVSKTFFSPIILPPPSSIAEGLRTFLTADWFPQHVKATLTETLLGFLFGGVVSISIAASLHFFRTIRKILYPYIIFLQLTPAIVMAPIFIIWFGFGLTSKIMVAALTSFFVILVSALAGFDSVRKDSVDLLRSMVASRRQIFFLVTVRTALPHIFAGLKTGITLALIGALVAEFIASQAGLGLLLMQFSFSLRQSFVFATVIVITLMGAALFGAITFLERKIVWWER